MNEYFTLIFRIFEKTGHFYVLTRFFFWIYRMNF